MATNNFSNLPTTPPPSGNSVNNVVNTFNSYYEFPIQLDASTFNAILGFFENKGFDKTSAQSITTIMMTQSIQDNINPMTIIDSLGGLNGADLSDLATQILNYNRFKSSYLGVASTVKPFQQVQRNIIA